MNLGLLMVRVCMYYVKEREVTARAGLLCSC